MATRSHAPNMPDHLVDFRSAIAYLCEEAERIDLVQIRAVLQCAWAHLPVEIATLREGPGQHHVSQHMALKLLPPEFSIFHSWRMVLFALYSSAHVVQHRRRAVSRFFDAQVRQVLAIAVPTPLLDADVDELVEVTRTTAQRLTEHLTDTSMLSVVQEESVRKQIDSLMPSDYGND